MWLVIKKANCNCVKGTIVVIYEFRIIFCLYKMENTFHDLVDLC